ncbi:MAG: preprotein translocase subunit SecA [bacterium]
MTDYVFCFLMNILTKILGDPNQRVIDKLEPLVEKINQLESKFEKLSPEELKAQTELFQERLKKGETLDELLPEAFAAVREAAKRTLGQRHFDVQLIGGIVLHRGEIAEMKTGEGKTLTATLPVYLNALTGKGVHLITVNDYLAQRDSVWMGQVYHALGLTIGCIQHETAFLFDQAVENSLKPVNRKEAYLADITYGTNNEFGFDYLRDNMVDDLERMVQRELHFAIVDEVDSILIDEARTPLIISAPAEEGTEMYYKFSQLVKRLKENEDYNIDEKMRAATLTEEGINKMERWLGVDNIYTAGGVRMVHHIEQALRAMALFKLDRDYVIKDGEIIIVDEFTGRLMFGRRYSEGLHQAIEAKEGVPIQRESQTLATITFQNYFRLYEKLAGMTGTAVTEAEEFAKIYNLEVVIIPTNKPMIRRDLADRVYRSEAGKFQAVIEEIKIHHQKGQPLLVGTISIEKNEFLSQLLSRAGIAHNLLNAKQHEKEAQIIADAGKIGAVTIATNMAGRGVDIILGGRPPAELITNNLQLTTEQKGKLTKWQEEHDKVVASGGLHIIGTERHESRRIDNQLRGRSGRQGDPGSSQFYVSMEDDLMRIFGGERMKNLMTTLRVPEDMPIENRMVSRSIESAQKKVEAHHFDIRKHLVEYDDIINKHREVIYKKRCEILEIVKAEEEEKAEEKLHDEILKMVEKEIEQIVLFHTDESKGDWSLKEIYEAVKTIFPVTQELELRIEEISQDKGQLGVAEIRTKIINYLFDLAHKAYEQLENKVLTNSNDPKLMRVIEKGILLRVIDTLWIEHLEAIDHLRTGIGLRGYGQRDPLVEYKKEAFRIFTELVNLIQKEVVYSIYKISFAQKIAPSLMQTDAINVLAPSKTMEKGTDRWAQTPLTKEANQRSQDSIPAKMRDAAGQKVGRNDPCPCGATKSDGRPIKYKHCHGKGA